MLRLEGTDQNGPGMLANHVRGHCLGKGGSALVRQGLEDIGSSGVSGN